MARESHPPNPGATTPTRRAVSAEPTTASAGSRRSILIRTPGSQGRGLPYRLQGLSASGRKPTAPGPSATPHARAAFRTIDSRRAAISTPHRPGRRRSVREARETPRDFLLSLGRVLARTTEPIASSSSSSSSPRRLGNESIAEETLLGGDNDDDEEEELPKRPRLSLPIDAEDEDDSDLRPHRSAALEDDNFTMQSIELPRRALSEQPGTRFSLGSVRMSDYFGGDGLRSEDVDVGIDSGFFPPMGELDEAMGGAGMEDDEMPSYERHVAPCHSTLSRANI